MELFGQAFVLDLVFGSCAACCAANFCAMQIFKSGTLMRCREGNLFAGRLASCYQTCQGSGGLPVHPFSLDKRLLVLNKFLGANTCRYRRTCVVEMRSCNAAEETLARYISCICEAEAFFAVAAGC